MQSAGSVLEEGVPGGRLPKPTPSFLKPFGRFLPEHQLYRAQEYHEETKKDVIALKDNHPGWSKKRQFAALVRTNREVGDSLEQLYDKEKWELRETREAKHLARAHHISVKRSSKQAEQEAIDGLVKGLPDIEQDMSRGPPSSDQLPVEPVSYETTVRQDVPDRRVLSESDISNARQTDISSAASSPDPEDFTSSHPSVVLPNLPVV